MNKIKCPSNLLYGQKSPILRHIAALTIFPDLNYFPLYGYGILKQHAFSISQFKIHVPHSNWHESIENLAQPLSHEVQLGSQQIPMDPYKEHWSYFFIQNKLSLLCIQKAYLGEKAEDCKWIITHLCMSAIHTESICGHFPKQLLLPGSHGSSHCVRLVQPHGQGWVTALLTPQKSTFVVLLPLSEGTFLLQVTYR